MAETRLTPEIELDGLTADEAFAVLGNETRLDIVRALWRAEALREYDDLHEEAATLPFSDLRRRVDIEDNGQFNYHLSKLVPHFVRRTERGYRLSDAGTKIARTVVAISGNWTPDVSDRADVACPVCGAPVAVSYRDQWLRVACTECEGLFGDAVPEGTLLNGPFPPGGLADRSPEDAFRTQLSRCHLDLAYLMRGVCRECAGPVAGSVSACDDHGAGAGHGCAACGTPFEVWGELRCETCRFAKRLPVELCVLGLAPVIGFLDRQGIDALAPVFEELGAVFEDSFATSYTEDPLRVTVELAGDAERLQVTLDGALNVVEVSRGE